MVHNFFRFDIVHSSVFFVTGFFFLTFDVHFQLNLNIILFLLAVQLEAWHRKMRTILFQTMKEIMEMIC